jgi:hypothetical protein
LSCIAIFAFFFGIMNYPNLLLCATQFLSQEQSMSLLVQLD